jgi:hypothetical protein
MKRIKQNEELLAFRAGGTYIQLPLGCKELMFWERKISQNLIIIGKYFFLWYLLLSQNWVKRPLQPTDIS